MAALNGYSNVTAFASDSDELVLWQSGAVVNMTWGSFRTVLDGRYQQTASHGISVNGVVVQAVQYIAVTEAGSATISDNTAAAVLSTAGAFTAFTLTMPPAPVEAQRVRVAIRATITTLTHSPNTGQTLLGALTTSGGNAFGEWQWRSSNSTWFRIG